MAAPEPGVLSSVPVPGKSGSRGAWGTSLFSAVAPSRHLFPGPFSGQFSLSAFLGVPPGSDSARVTPSPHGPGSHWFTPTLPSSRRFSGPRLTTLPVNPDQASTF